MTALAKLFLVSGGANLALVVALGAFGAHFLRTRMTGEMMAVYHTAILYHAIHALGLIALGLAAGWLPRSGCLRAAGWTMMAGIVAFCGSLYILSVTGIRWLGAVTPVGGSALIIAWLLFCIAILTGGDAAQSIGKKQRRD